MKRLNSISLIIPAYNEKDRIETTINSYLNYLRKNFSDFELIVVCNNCSDRTPEIVNKFSKKNKNVIFMNFPFYTGKGGAVIEGIKKAGKDLIGFADADESTAPKEFHKLVKAIEGSDIAIASRALPESAIPVKQPIYREILGRIYSMLVELLFGLGIRDTQCGAKLFRKKVIREILPFLKSYGFEFDVELLWKARRKGFSIREVPIVWRNSEKSLVGILDPFKMFLGLLKLRYLS